MSSPEREPHQVRDVAESFGANAGRYNRARPSYPAPLIETIVARSPGRHVLDVGCGTGIVARQFQSAGCSVLGVEPDPRMAEVARADGLEVEVAKFEDWDPAGRQFDAVVAGQAWHWVDPVAGAAQAAGALRPGGRLALFWNSFLQPDVLGEGTDQPAPAGEAAGHAGGHRRRRRRGWRRLHDALRGGGRHRDADRLAPRGVGTRHPVDHSLTPGHRSADNHPGDNCPLRRPALCAHR
jgi:SAM-dependent methyltransferase